MTTAVVGMLVVTGFTWTPQDFSIAPESARRRACARADDGHAHGGDGRLELIPDWLMALWPHVGRGVFPIPLTRVGAFCWR